MVWPQGSLRVAFSARTWGVASEWEAVKIRAAMARKVRNRGRRCIM
jgi:hypothetical protein